MKAVADITERVAIERRQWDRDGKLDHEDAEPKTDLNVFRLSRYAITLDLLRFTADGHDISPMEVRLLAFFMSNPDRVLTRGDIREGIGRDDLAIEVYVARLRRHWPRLIHTVVGTGYQFGGKP